MKRRYLAYLLECGGDGEKWVGEFNKLSPALGSAKIACHFYGEAKWDWVVETYADGERLSVRSSVGGYER